MSIDSRCKNNLFKAAFAFKLTTTRKRQLDSKPIHRYTSLIIKGCRIKVEYSQEYELESKLLELRIYPAHDKLHEILEKTLLDNGYIIKEILPIGNPPYSKVFYLEGKRNESDIEDYIKILSNLSKLY